MKMLYVYWGFTAVILIGMVFLQRVVRQEWKTLFFLLGLKAALALFAGVFFFQRHESSGMEAGVPDDSWLIDGLFLDWLITTPLSLVVIWHVLQLQVKTNHIRIVVELIALDLLMLGLGYVANVTFWRAESQWNVSTGWMLFVLSAVCMIALFVRLYQWKRENMEVARHEGDSVDPSISLKMFDQSIGFVYATWTLFPILWLISPFGLAWLNWQLVVALLWAVNLISKSGFVLIHAMPFFDQISSGRKVVDVNGK